MPNDAPSWYGKAFKVEGPSGILAILLTSGLLGVPLRVTSGFRSSAVNQAIKGAAGSQHMRGEAADIVPVGMDVETAMGRIVAARLPVDQLIVYPRGGFLHVSHAAQRVQRNELLRSAAPGGSGGPYSRWTP